MVTDVLGLLCCFSLLLDYVHGIMKSEDYQIILECNVAPSVSRTMTESILQKAHRNGLRQIAGEF